MKIMVLLGAPGSGKGTVAARLAKRLPARHVASGDLLRAVARQPVTETARKVAHALQHGQLVPDAVVDALIAEELARMSDEKGWLLLDGYPRTVHQAEKLLAMAAQAGGSLAQALLLDASEPVLIRRLAGRRICPRCAAGYHVDTLPPRVAERCDACGAHLERRADDEPDKIPIRLAVYRRESAALIEWFAARGLLVRVDGDGGADAVTDLAARMVSQ